MAVILGQDKQEETRASGLQKSSIWGEYVSRSSLYLTGTLGEANIKKNTFPLHQLKKEFQCSDDLRKPRPGTTKTCALIFSA